MGHHRTMGAKRQENAECRMSTTRVKKATTRWGWGGKKTQNSNLGRGEIFVFVSSRVSYEGNSVFLTMFEQATGNRVARTRKIDPIHFNFNLNLNLNVER